MRRRLRKDVKRVNNRKAIRERVKNGEVVMGVKRRKELLWAGGREGGRLTDGADTHEGAAAPHLEVPPDPRLEGCFWG